MAVSRLWPRHQLGEHPPQRQHSRLIQLAQPLGHLVQQLVDLGAQIGRWWGVEVIGWGGQ
jgi:hypothetical protein